jgi:hypothetical protein
VAPAPPPVQGERAPAATLSAPAVTLRGRRPPLVAFTLAAPGTVSVVLERRSGARWTRVARRRVALRAGAQRVAVASPGTRLRRGTYRVTLRAANVRRIGLQIR